MTDQVLLAYRFVLCCICVDVHGCICVGSSDCTIHHGNATIYCLLAVGVVFFSALDVCQLTGHNMQAILYEVALIFWNVTFIFLASRSTRFFAVPNTCEQVLCGDLYWMRRGLLPCAL